LRKARTGEKPSSFDQKIHNGYTLWATPAWHRPKAFSDPKAL